MQVNTTVTTLQTQSLSEGEECPEAGDALLHASAQAGRESCTLLKRLSFAAALLGMWHVLQPATASPSSRACRGWACLCADAAHLPIVELCLSPVGVSLASHPELFLALAGVLRVRVRVPVVAHHGQWNDKEARHFDQACRARCS
eukprot:3173805-Amphidinium_carterae.1